MLGRSVIEFGSGRGTDGCGAFEGPRGLIGCFSSGTRKRGCVVACLMGNFRARRTLMGQQNGMTEGRFLLGFVVVPKPTHSETQRLSRQRTHAELTAARHFVIVSLPMTPLVDASRCQHCGASGTCTTGNDGFSCARCKAVWAERDKLDSKGDYKGLVCSVCFGRGIAESSRVKWEYRFPAALALIFVLLTFLLLFLSKPIGIPSGEAMTFAGTLVGSITGFYFGGAKTGSNSTADHSAPNAPPAVDPVPAAVQARDDDAKVPAV